MAMGMLHPAVSAIMKAADVGQANNPDVIMRIKLLATCQSVCAIEGLIEGRDADANLVTAAAPAINSSNAVCCVCFCHPPPHQKEHHAPYYLQMVLYGAYSLLNGT
jgi:hypothetical protein